MLAALPDLVAASPWAYAALLAIAALDAVFPVVPSEATLLSAAVLAGTGNLNIALVVSAAAAGALVGDNCGYFLGRTLGVRLEQRIARSRRAASGRDWAEGKLQSSGAWVLLVARFVPGGRTAATTTAGLVRVPWRRFVRLAGFACLLWASGFGLLGYSGGRTVEEHPCLLVPFLLAAAGAAYGSAALALRSPELMSALAMLSRRPCPRPAPPVGR
jgi:membrane protein DedA with SNARE-associated domain